MTKRIVLLISASMAAGVCSLAQEVRFTADPAVKKIQVLDIQSSGNCLEAYGYSVNNLNDDNLCSECAVEWDYENDVDFVFTLAEKHIGTFLLYNGGYDSENAEPEASSAKLVDVGSGKDLGEYVVLTEYKQPFIAVVNKELTPCEDGKFRIRVFFRVNSLTPIGMATQVFCIREVSFWKDNVINPVWPVGDRAVYGVWGPVKKVGDVEFDRDGKEVSRNRNEDGNPFEYDDKGRLWNNGSYEWYKYGDDNDLFRGKDAPGLGWSIIRYEFEKGRLMRIHEEEKIQNAYMGADAFINTDYTILAVDKYGNWTKRRCERSIDSYEPETETYVEEREIFYY